MVIVTSALLKEVNNLDVYVIALSLHWNRKTLQRLKFLTKKNNFIQ